MSFLLLDRIIGDGMNEKGLAAGEVYPEGFAAYLEYDPDLSDHSLSPTDVRKSSHMLSSSMRFCCLIHKAIWVSVLKDVQSTAVNHS